MEEALKPLLGVWKCDNTRTENFEEFLTEMGLYSFHLLEFAFFFFQSNYCVSHFTWNESNLQPQQHIMTRRYRVQC